MSTEPDLRSNSARGLALVLRAMGCFDVLALLAVIMPREWLDLAHRGAGLGALPEGPIVGYLARSASALYALHGAIVVFISFDVGRYERLIRFMALAALFHGIVILGIDLAEQMPPLWRIAEGPCFSATGAVVLWLVHKMGRVEPQAAPKAGSSGAGGERTATSANSGTDQPKTG